MGASVSSTSLYKVIATVEIVSSAVITVFGVNTFLLFNQMGDKFKEEMEMIRYSSIVAVAQCVLTMLASLFLVGCHFSSLRQDTLWVQSPQQGSPPIPNIGRKHSLRRKAIAPTWIAWTLISISCLLFVFIGPMHYCIQTDSDLEDLSKLTAKNGYYETIDRKRLGVCHSFSNDLSSIRSTLRDLYSNAIIGIIFKLLFILLVYQNWKYQMKNGKKIVIYIEGCDSNNEEFESDPKAMCSSTSTTGFAGVDTGVSENGGGEAEKKEEKSAKVVIVVEEVTKK